MESVWRALLQSWGWRVEVILPLILFGGVYTLGWARLFARRQGALAARWRLVCYWLGLGIIALALMSPVDWLGTQLFTAHMIQHLLLVMIAPPLLLLAQPFPLLLWGLPRPRRRRIGSWFARKSAVRFWLTRLTRPWWVWLASMVILWGWHIPAAYEAALRSDFVHDLEHLSFFGSGMLFWWSVTAVGPRLQGQAGRGTRIVLLLATVPINVLLSMLIALADQPIYPYYTTVPRLWGLTVLQDQMLGGAIMWVPGSMMYVVAATILLFRLFQIEGGSDWSGQPADIKQV
jgi:cytochrome c oxidase assembly factor CtaG